MQNSSPFSLPVQITKTKTRQLKGQLKEQLKVKYSCCTNFLISKITASIVVRKRSKIFKYKPVKMAFLLEKTLCSYTNRKPAG